MAQKTARSLDHRLAALRALDPSAPSAVAALREALRSANGTLIALAAKLVAEHTMIALYPDVGAAFADLCTDERVKRDPICRGKIAIVHALHDVDHWDERVFKAGLRVVQREGMHPAEDTAAPVRGLCGLAYARMLRTDAADVLAELLADDHKTARIAAAQALGNLGRADFTAVLRFKLLAEPDEPEVESVCFESLLSIAREASIEFVTRFLDDGGERAEVAAIALGGTRDPSVVDPLVVYARSTTGSSRAVAYLALALLRLDAANRVLLGAIRTNGKADALAATQALATFKDDPATLRALREAIGERTDKATRVELEALLA